MTVFDLLIRATRGFPKSNEGQGVMAKTVHLNLFYLKSRVEGRLLRRCLGNTPPLRPGLQACCPRNHALNSDFRQREGAQARLVLRNLSSAGKLKLAKIFNMLMKDADH